MWLVNHSDLDDVEAAVRERLRCETPDPPILRSAAYVTFRRRCIDHMGGMDSVARGESVRLGNVTILVLAAHPEGVLEVHVMDWE